MFARSISRRAFSAAAVLTAAAVGTPALRAQAPRPEKSRVTITVGSRSALSALPLTIAEQLGYFRDEGLQVEVFEHQNGARSLQQGAGAADIFCGAFEQVIQLQGRGQFFQAFVLQARAPQVAMGVSTRALPIYRRVADLRGRRIGLATPASSSATVARLVLARGGLRPADVSFIGIGREGDALAAFRAGRFDAISHIDPLMTQLEQRGELRIISDTRTLKGTQEIFGGPMPASCLHAPQAFVQKNPVTCQALANAIVHALKWLQTAGPSDIVKTVPEPYFMGDRALYLAAFNKVREAISPDGLITEEGVRTAVRIMAAFDPAVRVGKIDASRCYTNDFARRAKDKFDA